MQIWTVQVRSFNFRRRTLEHILQTRSYLKFMTDVFTRLRLASKILQNLEISTFELFVCFVRKDNAE